jgi:hypothetical protein
VFGTSYMFIYYSILFILHIMCNIIIFVYISVLVIVCQYTCLCRFLFAYNFSVNTFMQVIHNVFKITIERGIHPVLAHLIFLRAESRLNYFTSYHWILSELYFIVCNSYLLCFDSLLALTLWLMHQTYTVCREQD